MGNAQTAQARRDAGGDPGAAVGGSQRLGGHGRVTQDFAEVAKLLALLTAIVGYAWLAWTSGWRYGVSRNSTVPMFWAWFSTMSIFGPIFIVWRFTKSQTLRDRL